MVKCHLVACGIQEALRHPCVKAREKGRLIDKQIPDLGAVLSIRLESALSMTLCYEGLDVWVLGRRCTQSIVIIISVQMSWGIRLVQPQPHS